MLYNNKTGYLGRTKILDLSQSTDGNITVRSRTNSSRITFSRMKGCDFTGGRETVFLTISELNTNDSGFYFCSYDQIFLESSWLIVMKINPAVYQLLILASVFVFYVIVYVIAWIHKSWIEKKK